MRISDWSSDVCSSDLGAAHHGRVAALRHQRHGKVGGKADGGGDLLRRFGLKNGGRRAMIASAPVAEPRRDVVRIGHDALFPQQGRESGAKRLFCLWTVLCIGIHTRLNLWPLVSVSQKQSKKT